VPYKDSSLRVETRAIVCKLALAGKQRHDFATRVYNVSRSCSFVASDNQGGACGSPLQALTASGGGEGKEVNLEREKCNADLCDPYLAVCRFDNKTSRLLYVSTHLTWRSMRGWFSLLKGACPSGGGQGLTSQSLAQPRSRVSQLSPNHRLELNPYAVLPCLYGGLETELRLTVEVGGPISIV
jgi:hypothetical protein